MATGLPLRLLLVAVVVLPTLARCGNVSAPCPARSPRAATPWSWRGPRASSTASPLHAAPSASAPLPRHRERHVADNGGTASSRPLIEYLVGNLLAATAAPDPDWAASAERQRCFMRSSAPTPVAGLVARLAENELNLCDPALLWDASMPAVDETLRQVLSALSRPYVLARTTLNTAPSWLSQPVSPPYGRRRRGHWRDVLPPRQKCRHILVVVDDVMAVGAMLGNLSEARVVVVTRSPKWRIRDYLASPMARNIRNLLVVHDRTWRHGSSELGFPDMDLYTHRLFVDSLGYSEGHVLTAWRCDRLTRPDTELFPLKMRDGFAGHQFTVSASETPPYMYRTVLNADGDLSWDGIEIRLLKLLAERLNFSISVREATADDTTAGGSAVRVVRNIVAGTSELGAGGIYVTQPRIKVVDISFYHTQDCASFITLASVALPRYRAIMGPFQWTVWLALTLTYMGAIVPLVFSHSFSLRVLIKNPGQIETMFWYVFGTFTNAFSFKGRDSWTGTDRTSTRMIIGWYWVFSIIVTACYTGCIISFIAFPVFPEVVDHIWQLIEGRYRIGTLRTDGWPTWFLNSSDPMTDKLLKNMDTVPAAWDGLVNMTRAYFWRPYSFLGSRLYLEHVVRTNYTAENKRSHMHIARECLVPFWVALIFPKAATYSERFNQLLMRAMQTGITEKLRRDVAWDVMRTTKGAKGRTLLQVSSGSALRLPPPEERMLTLDDTQGMFLLLGAGFAIAGAALLFEKMVVRVGCCRRHCEPGPRRRSSVASVPSALLGSDSRCASARRQSGVTVSTAPSRAGSGSTRGSQDGVDGVRKRRASATPSAASSVGLGREDGVAYADVHAGRGAVGSVFSRVLYSVAASVAFRAAGSRAGPGVNRADEGGLAAQRIPEDQVLHLSNAWGDVSGMTSDGDDAHLRVVGRCRHGSMYPTGLPPTTPEQDADEDEGDGEAADGPDDAGRQEGWGAPSGQSSLFGSPVRPLGSWMQGLGDVEADAEPDADAEMDDASTYMTYILLHGSAGDVRQPARPPTPYGQRPAANQLGHRRRASVAVSVDLEAVAVASEQGGSTPPEMAPPPGSFPDSPPPRREET